MYVFSEKSTSHAISRSGYRTINKGDIIQLNLSADCLLRPNMTFQVDTFISGDGFGVGWEKGVAITEDGCTSMTDYLKKGIIELDV